MIAPGSMLLTAAVGNDCETYTRGYFVGRVVLRVLAAPPVDELDGLPKGRIRRYRYLRFSVYCRVQHQLTMARFRRGGYWSYRGYQNRCPGKIR